MSNYKGFPTVVKQNSIGLNRAAIDHEIGLPASFCITPWYLFVAYLSARHVDGETTTGHSRLRTLQRTLMKDARQGLHSLVEAQN